MFLMLAPAVGASVASLWVAALVAMPRTPLADDEVQELVCGRLLGRQHYVLLLAMIGTMFGMLTLVLSMPSRQQIYFSESASTSICYTPQSSGAWIEERWQAEGTWRVVGLAFAVPHPPGEKDATP